MRRRFRPQEDRLREHQHWRHGERSSTSSRDPALGASDTQASRWLRRCMPSSTRVRAIGSGSSTDLAGATCFSAEETLAP
eukprot:5345887-Prymnesium_polylepis.4